MIYTGIHSGIFFLKACALSVVIQDISHCIASLNDFCIPSEAKQGTKYIFIYPSNVESISISGTGVHDTKPEL